MKLFHNPEYDEMRPEWQVAHDLYEGCHNDLTSFYYLWPHYIEMLTDGKSPLARKQAEELRAARAQRTRYFNIPEIVVSLWTSIFFREPPFVPDAVKEIFGSDRKFSDVHNIDGYGKSLFKFVKDEMFVNYLLYGRIFTLANAPQGEIKTVADEKAQGIIPRLKCLSPLCVTDWDIEHADGTRIGRLNMLRHEYHYREPRLTETTEPRCLLRSDALRVGPYSVTEYQAENADKVKSGGDLEWASLGTTPIPKLQEIPVAYVFDRPWLRECNEETLRFHNLRSNKDNIQYNQGMDSGFIAGDESQSPAEFQALTEYTWKILKKDSTAFKLPPVDVEGYSRALEDSKTTAFALGLNMLRMLPGTSKEAPSAESASAEKENIYALADSTLDDIEKVTNDAIRYAAEFKGIKDFAEEVKFPRTLDEESLTDFVTLSQAFQDRLSKFPKAAKEILLKAANKLDLSDEAIKEIQDTDFAKAQEQGQMTPEQQRQALLDNVIPPKVPAEQ